MEQKGLAPEQFAALLEHHPVVDLRRAKEFRALALPFAHHLPVQEFHDPAGLTSALHERFPGQACLLYDRAGERSVMLEQVPDCRYLSGGMQAWERWQNDVYAGGPSLLLLGGLTGSGKTEMLHLLRQRGEQVIDLEGIARHRGSVFGNLWKERQEENGMFQYRILRAWQVLDPSRVVWLEEEGAFLGQNSLPAALFVRMLTARMIALDVPFEERLDRIVSGYGDAPAGELIAGIRKLEKRLGIHQCQRAMHLFEAGKIRDSFSILLRYYDRTYLHRRENQHLGPVIHLPHTGDHTDLPDRLIGLSLRPGRP